MNSEKMPKKSEEQFDYIYNTVLFGTEEKLVFCYNDLFNMIMSGFVALIMDGVPKAIIISMQGFLMRGIEEPSTDIIERGSREGFVETLKINQTMVRKRMKTPYLKFETIVMGKTSHTNVCLCYLSDRIQPQILTEVKKRLRKAKLDTVMASGFIQPYLDAKGINFFSAVGVTERPDVLCAKMGEGRIGVIVDGTPFALYVPYLFIENFQAMDDYANLPYYSTLIRWLKYIAFFITIFLPGLYVAVGTYHQEMFPPTILYDIASSEVRTPFPLAIEALAIHIIYEIVREAGLRLPRPIGNTVSIFGALVIGDAAVKARLIGAPMLIVVALTAISSYAVPSISKTVTFLRLALIIVGGSLGLYGMVSATAILVANMCAENPYGVPFTSPVMPFEARSMRDVLMRASWKILEKRTVRFRICMVRRKKTLRRKTLDRKKESKCLADFCTFLSE